MKTLTFLLLLLWLNNVYAYLDPATGSLIIQSLIALITGAIFTLKIYWQQFKNWLNRVRGQKNTINEDEKELDNDG